MTRRWPIVLGGLVAMILVLAPAAAAPDPKPPRILAAAMLDADGDSRADRVRLTYSERVRHRRDRDGRYPFAVSPYRIRSVGNAVGKTLVVLLVEREQPDPNAAPAIRYRRTSAQPVQDNAGNQAPTQRFVRTKAHGRVPATPTPLDADGDGTRDADDCAPRNAAIHPKAADTPDLGFVDSNCDGIDGTERDAIFVAPDGGDANPGTKAKPKRELQAAIATILAGKGRYVLVAFGSYARVRVVSGIGIFGGYDPSSWTRRDRFPDGLPLISGSPEGVLASGAKDVVLQHLRIRGQSAGASDRSAYGIRAIGSASLTLQRVAVTSGDGLIGAVFNNAAAGAAGGAGGPGGRANCDGNKLRFGGPGGSSPGESSTGERLDGKGGIGGSTVLGDAGDPGFRGAARTPGVGAPGGPGGKNGNPGKAGGRGASGDNGSSGQPGVGGVNSAAGAGEVWVGRSGGGGGVGGLGNGGGGGGGGGAQRGVFTNDGAGNGGGGGGGGGAGGRGGVGGGPGGGSFGIYLFNSKVVVEDSTIAAGTGGAGGRGSSGGLGGAGGAGGKGGQGCTSEVGAGGDGGFGGAGGRGGGGGGGAGGPSIGIYKSGSVTATLKGASRATAGTPGAGGAGGRGGPGGIGAAGAAGIAGPVFP